MYVLFILCNRGLFKGYYLLCFFVEKKLLINKYKENKLRLQKRIKFRVWG